MAGGLAIVVVVVMVLPALFLAMGAMVCAALGVTLSRPFSRPGRSDTAHSSGS